eukprot:8791372-Alexandrium_andersonii.AAC.1
MSSKAVDPKQAKAGKHGGGGPSLRAGGPWPAPAWEASSASASGRQSSQPGRRTRTGSTGEAGPTSIPNWAPKRM